MRSALIAALLLLAGTVRAQHLRPLRDQHHADGGGCSLRLPGAPESGDDVFQWDFEKLAWINVGGADVRLDVITVEADDRNAIGDRTVLQLRAKHLRVTVSLRTTSRCDEKDESCEAWSEQGTIEVTTRGGTIKRRVEGACGV